MIEFQLYSKYFFCILAHSGPAICLLGICFTGCKQELTIALLTLGVTLQGALYTGFFVNPLDIAPNFAGEISND